MNIAQGDFKEEFAIIAKAQGKTIAVLVDSLKGQKDIVVKPLSALFKNQREFSGATILGDGMVTLIIDVTGLI